MFSRQNETYAVDPNLLSHIFSDEANPLNRIAKIIPEKAKVLDIGAGNGLLANVLLHSHAEVVVDGIEPSAHAAKLASQYYRNFYTGYAQDFFPEIQRENYDYIILADVIEHMPDPLIFLQLLYKHTGASTKIVISTPNVAFGAVRVALMNGEFRYVDSGLLERTHLRFFTRETLLEMCKKSGFHTEKFYFLYRDMMSCEIKIFPNLKNFIYLLLLARDELAHTYQFLLVLDKNDRVIKPNEIAKYGSKQSVVTGFLRVLLRTARNALRNRLKGFR